MPLLASGEVSGFQVPGAIASRCWAGLLRGSYELCRGESIVLTYCNDLPGMVSLQIESPLLTGPLSKTAKPWEKKSHHRSQQPAKTHRCSTNPRDKKTSQRLASKNGAKETRTPDPLHAMKILAKLRSVATTSYNLSSTSAFGGPPPHLRQLAMARKGRNQT